MTVKQCSGDLYKDKNLGDLGEAYPTESKDHQVINYIHSQLSGRKQIKAPSAEEQSMCVEHFLFP